MLLFTFMYIMERQKFKNEFEMISVIIIVQSGFIFVYVVLFFSSP